MISVTSCAPQGVTSVVQAPEEKEFSVDITLEGGSGKASVNSPVKVISSDGEYYATLVWSSKNYDYVLVDGVRYENEDPGGFSTFTVPVKTLDEPFTFIADTLAMSTPHEIEYKIFWYSDGDGNDPGDGASSGRHFGEKIEEDTDIVIEGLEETGRLQPEYAKGFSVAFYGDYSLISVYGVGNFLLVPEGKSVPDNLPEGVSVLQRPFERTYIVSTSAMDLVRECGCLDKVRFSPLREDEWYIDEVRSFMKDKKMEYAGKYRAPDYELLIGGGCDLAVENTMIYHNPKVMDKLVQLGIPVIVETSSYESSPLARLEWIKLYGVLFDRQKEAEDFFNRQVVQIKDIGYESSSGKKIAFFSVSPTGIVSVRKSGDYMAEMIRLAGGEYLPENTGTDSGGGSFNMQPEDFYASVKDADIVIYNGTIEGAPNSLSELEGLSPLICDIKAVKERNVYCLPKGFFQHTTGMTDLITDIRSVLDGNTGNMCYLYRLE